jgi:sugar phosphate isomerase/epimerase
MDRREFLLTAAALALPRPDGRRLRIALTPGSIGVGAASQKALNDLAFRHGFEAVEPRTAELAAMSDAQAEEIRADLAAKKLAWAAAGLPVEFRKDEAGFRDGVAKLPALAAGLKRAGATRVGTWLSPSHAELTYLQNFKRHAERLREVAKILKDHGLRFGLEYVGTQSSRVNRRYAFVHTMAETRELIAEIGTGNVGVVPDSWHWWQAGDTEADLLALKNEDVVSVDLNDAPAGLAKEAQKDGQRELPCATGVIDLAVFVNALQKIGYDGPARPEPFNKALNDLDDEAACAASAAALKKAMALIR